MDDVMRQNSSVNVMSALQDWLSRKQVSLARGIRIYFLSFCTVFGVQIDSSSVFTDSYYPANIVTGR